MFFLLQDFYFMLQSKINGRNVLSLKKKKTMTLIVQGGPLSSRGSKKESTNESTSSDGDQPIPKLSCTDGSIQHNVAEGTTGRRKRQNAPKDESYYSKDNPRDTELL